MSEFREASCESQFLTGTPSVRNLKFRMRPKFVLEIPVTVNGCEFCKDFLYSRTCVGTPNTMVQGIINFAMLTRDCREYSHYSRSSVGNPDLKSNPFIDALNVCRKTR